LFGYLDRHQPPRRREVVLRVDGRPGPRPRRRPDSVVSLRLRAGALVRLRILCEQTLDNLAGSPPHEDNGAS
jgi:hypothetical protein